MATYKTSDEVVDLVYALLTPVLGVPVYSHRKPTVEDHETYVVVNSLPVDATVLQKAHANVNVHSKDLADGTPNTLVIRPIVKQVVALLEHYTSPNKQVLIDIETGGSLNPDFALNEHYYNLRFVVKTINT